MRGEYIDNSMLAVGFRYRFLTYGHISRAKTQLFYTLILRENKYFILHLANCRILKNFLFSTNMSYNKIYKIRTREIGGRNFTYGDIVYECIVWESIM
jgi:hypothetical protein